MQTQTQMRIATTTRRLTHAADREGTRSFGAERALHGHVQACSRIHLSYSAKRLKRTRARLQLQQETWGEAWQNHGHWKVSTSSAREVKAKSQATKPLGGRRRSFSRAHCGHLSVVPTRIICLFVAFGHARRASSSPPRKRITDRPLCYTLAARSPMVMHLREQHVQDCLNAVTPAVGIFEMVRERAFYSYAYTSSTTHIVVAKSFNTSCKKATNLTRLLGFDCLGSLLEDAQR
jgi:hypothetical protein